VVTSISFLAARVGCEGPAAYRSTKGGLELHCADRVLTDMETKAWDAEEESAPVNVRIPPHRLGTPWELADLGLFLSSPASDVICGQVFFIDGGYGAV
jgi:NAD(P)-dependent dehydrogenase (short-subunit alcohol dehydrogenase family)